MFISNTSRRTLNLLCNVSDRALTAAASSRSHFHTSPPTSTPENEATLRMQALMLEIPADLKIPSTDVKQSATGYKIFNEQSQSTGRRAPPSKSSASASSPQPQESRGPRVPRGPRDPREARGPRAPRQQDDRRGPGPKHHTAESASPSTPSSSPIERQQNASRQQATAAPKDRQPRQRRDQNENRFERKTTSPHMNTEGNANSRSRTGSSPNTRGESSRRPRQFETKGESATPAPPVRNTFKPEADWQPTRKRAEELFGASRSVLPVDSDLMANAGQMSEKVAVKWDGGKANRLRQAATDQGDYTTFLPSNPLILDHVSGSEASEQAVNNLNWMLARNVSVSNRQRILAMGIAGDRLGA